MYLCVEQYNVLHAVPALSSGGSLDLVKTNSDIAAFRAASGASSVMLARAAMWNASVFREGGPLPLEAVMEDYLRHVRPRPLIGIFKRAISHNSH